MADDFEGSEGDDSMDAFVTLTLKRKKDKGKQIMKAEIGKQKKRAKTMKSRLGNSLLIRNSPAIFVQAMKDMNETQIVLVQEMWIGYMLNLKIPDIPRYMAYWVVENFNEASSELILKSGKNLHIASEDVYMAFGLPRGELQVPSRKVKDNKTILYEWKIWYTNANEENLTEVRPTHISNVLHEIVDETWFNRNFLQFFILTLVTTNQKGTCKHERFIEDVSNVSNMNWCQFVIDQLVKAKEAWHKNKKRFFQGPILFLILLYVDRVIISRKMNKSTFPLHLGWIDSLLRERQRKEDKLGGFVLGHATKRCTKIATEMRTEAEPSIHK